MAKQNVVADYDSDTDIFHLVVKYSSAENRESDTLSQGEWFEIVVPSFRKLVLRNKPEAYILIANRTGVSCKLAEGLINLFLGLD